MYTKYDLYKIEFFNFIDNKILLNKEFKQIYKYDFNRFIIKETYKYEPYFV